MPLSFLVPAFLAGLAALAIPIWVHLRNRPRQESVQFPSLMFLEQIPYRAVQRQQLRHRALFALRCFALALLALAFARPFLGGVMPAATAAAGAREVVVAVDRSWSMGYGDRWPRAVAAASEALAGLRAADRVSLVLFDTGAEVAVRSAGAASVRAALDAGAPGQAATDLGAGLRAAREILAASELPNREVVLVSDFQRAGWDGDADLELPEGTRVVPVSLAGDAVRNVSVADVQLDRLAAGDEFPERVEVTARLARVGEGEQTVDVTLEVDGQVLQSLPATLAGNDAARVTFEPVPLPAAGLRGTVRVPADALAADDTFHFTVSPGQALSVLVLDNPAGGGSDSLFLTRALAIGSRPAFRVERAVLGDLDPSRLQGRELVILNDVGAVDGGNASVLEGFVRDGGGLIVALAELSADLGGLGGPEGLLPLQAGEVVDRSDDLGGTLGFTDTDHPVFEVFAAPGSGDLAGARFFRYHDLRPIAGAGVLARYDDGAPALIERRVDRGRVLVWTTSLDTFWSDLPLQPVYLPFVHRLARHAAAFREPKPWLPAATPLATTELLATAGASAEPDAVSDLRVDGVTPSADGGLRLPTGHHTLRWQGGDGEATGTVAINVDRAESDLAAVDPEEVAAAVVWRGGGEVEGGETETVPEKEIERSQSVWWYLVVLAFVLLAAESALSNRLSPRAS